MYTYNINQLNAVLEIILKQTVSDKALLWLNEKATSFADQGQKAFFMAFSAAPRLVGKDNLIFTSAQQDELNTIRNGFSINGWTADRLARVWLLLKLPAENKENYLETINKLFPTGEMNELVALYSALPVLAYPKDWALRCAEGIRSNIGTVLEAIICDNPYPSEYLDEAAWNQLVMKAFFTEKPIHRITGLDKRANAQLATILSDFAHERWAANRELNYLHWRPVGKFIDERILTDLKRVLQNGSSIDKKAAALALSESNLDTALTLLNHAPELKKAIELNELTWDSLASEHDAVVS